LIGRPAEDGRGEHGCHVDEKSNAEGIYDMVWCSSIGGSEFVGEESGDVRLDWAVLGRGVLDSLIFKIESIGIPEVNH
jgi:hypothetical protein